MTPETVTKAFDRAIYTGMAVSLLAAPALSPRTVESGPVLCPFRRLTGLPCPGCGMTRSFVAVAHGDIGSAFAYNRLGPLLMAIFVIAVGWKLLSLVSGRFDPPEVVVRRRRQVDDPPPRGARQVPLRP